MALRELARRQGRTGQALMPVVFTSALGLGTAEENTIVPFLRDHVVYAISQTPQVWLDHQVIEQDDALVFHWDAVEALFPPGLLDDMFAAYCALLEQLATEEAVWTAPPHTLLPASQLAQRRQVNATAAPLADELLHTRFLHQVATQPDALAGSRRSGP